VQNSFVILSANVSMRLAKENYI